MRNLIKGTRPELNGAFLLSRIDPARVPAHVAVIMDGNGRWAARRSLPRVAGHRAGASAVRRTVEAAARLGIGCLTLYAFSTENWKRPRSEVDALMRLLREFLRKELRNLHKNNIRFQVIGRCEGLEAQLLEEIRKAEQFTSGNTGLTLSIAVNYGGRTEIVDACRRLALEVSEGRLSPSEIDDRHISENLYTRSLPDPDLLIRTSGEMRVSNFLIWQIAYSEIHVTPTCWPDFSDRDLYEAVLDYQNRDRRFGGLKHATEVPSVQ
ncbi:MAG TPA: isoprenyl transferase, partial [Blastocatellia bacterium]|nr:isoprenyl transferase [Blastocatellia bacterium]